MHFKPFIDWLTYRSYEHQRKSNPQIEYFRWRSIFTDAIAFEEIYDNYLNKNNVELVTNE